MTKGQQTDIVFTFFIIIIIIIIIKSSWSTRRGPIFAHHLNNIAKSRNATVSERTRRVA